MRELLAMWRHPRMVAAAVASAAAYAFLLLPFKGLAVVPGFASVRPAAALPVVLGLLFGPAGAWGAAVGNLVGDYFGGTWNPVTPYGFVGNFLFGLVGYKLWGHLGRLSSGDPPSLASGEQFPQYLVAATTAAALVAAVIGWGGAVTGEVPFLSLVTVIFVTDVVAAVVMGPPVLFFLYPRLAERGLLYPQVMSAGRSVEPGGDSRAGLVVVGGVLAWVALGLAVDALALGGRRVQVVLGAVALLVVLVGLARCSSAVETPSP